MKTLAIQPNLVEQIHDAILAKVASGRLWPGERIAPASGQAITMGP